MIYLTENRLRIYIILNIKKYINFCQLNENIIILLGIVIWQKDYIYINFCQLNENHMIKRKSYD